MALWHSDASNPRFEPPKDDGKAIDDFYQNVNRICNMKATTVSDWCKVSFACMAGVQTLQSQGAAKFTEARVSELRGVAGQRANRIYLKEYADPTVFLQDGTPAPTSFSVKSFFPKANPESPNGSAKSQWINKYIHFRHPKTGERDECTLVDFGTSYAQGDWFTLVNKDGDEVQINEREMDEILQNAL